MKIIQHTVDQTSKLNRTYHPHGKALGVCCDSYGKYLPCDNGNPLQILTRLLISQMCPKGKEPSVTMHITFFQVYQVSEP